MRRVDAEGDSRGVQGRKHAGGRFKARLRRASLESLERREMLSTSTSTLPSPTVLNGPSLTGTRSLSAVAAATALTSGPSANSPSIAVDPINPLKMVATWINHDATGYNRGNFVAPVTSYAQGAYSVDGGVNWTVLPASIFGPNSVNVQENFALARPTNGTINVFTQTTDASVGIDRGENVYLLTSTHDVADANGVTTAGVLDVQRLNFTGNSPVAAGVTTPVYSWDRADSAANSATVDAAVVPTLAVDTNLSSYTDPTSGTTQTDPYSGNVYVAWAEVDSVVYNNTIPNFNPNTIKLAASSNQGVWFTHGAYVDNSSNANGHQNAIVTVPPSNTPLHSSIARYTAPQIAISQGSATKAGGQVTIVYDDYGTQANLSPRGDRIIVQTNLLGGTSEQFDGPTLTGIDPSNGVSVPISVNINDPKFTTLQALDITTGIAYPTLADINAVIVPSTAANAYLTSIFGASYPGFIRLFTAGVGAGDGTINTGPNLGATALNPSTNPSFGTGSGVVFDTEAVRSIQNGNVGGTAVGHFQAEGSFFLAALKGATAAQLNGTWSLQVGIVAGTTPDTSTNPKYVNNIKLNFSSGNNPGSVLTTAGGEVVVANRATPVTINIPGINPTNSASSNGTLTNALGTNQVAGTVLSGSGNVTAAVQPTPILPAPVIASDNTLGSFSAHQGRIYVAFTGMFSNAQAGNTDIFLLYSDDYGQTWNGASQVNDDNAAVDGFSGSAVGAVNIAGVGTTLGRTQYEPQIAVDQSTGTLVLSYLDARNDPSNARVVTSIAASTDGGATFAANVYANASKFATDAATGNAVNLGPIPDNQSAASTVQDTVGFGAHQALAVVNGRIIPFWASNQNSSTTLKIVDSILSLPAGPRVIASTQGPVGVSGDAVNTTRAADGTTLANSFLVTFDRPIDPATFLTGNVSVYYKSPTGGTSISLPVTAVAAVTSTALGATQFKITFNPASLASFVGTYSYVIRPTGISDRIRHVVAGGTVAAGNVMDQNANGTPAQLPADDYVVGQPTGFTNYATGTLPLIVSGPHILATAAVDSTGTVIGTGTNGLVLNNSVGALQITFDRNIQVGSLTPAQILSIYSPAGVVPLTGLTITPLSVYTSSGQATYAGGTTANIFKISFATQKLSGTYSVTLGTGILAADGSGVDANLNAGLDVLRGTATNGATVPVSYPSSSTPSPIAAATVNPDGTTTPSVLMSPIVVPDNFPLQGDSGTISGITLTLNVTYPTDPDLVAYLLAPDGVTKVNLFTNVGAGTNTANFSNTTLSDTASTSITKAAAPFFGTFLPEAPFSNLATSAHLNSLGTWTLVIQNAGSNTGTLTNWSLTFRKPVSATGLAEFPNDQSTVNFQIFNLAATNQLANATWTAVGPAGITTSANGKGTFAGTISSIAVDPSDTTGNTVYVGSASGGIWKTTNFLTTNAGGPTYLPLTDFGPNFSLNIGGLAIFGRNNDPAQSIIFAGTGFGQERTNATAGNPNISLNSGRGVGIIRSTDGGKTWGLLPGFLGDSTNKIVVDPTPNLNGQAIVYAAMSSGLYKSLDSGNTWIQLKSGNATDIILDPNSKSPTTGNLDILYTAFSSYVFNGQNFVNGVFVSSNQGQTLLPVTGQLGKDPLIVTSGFPAQPIPVGNAGVTPNNINSAYIALAKPTLTSNIAVNLNYQGWLYAAVENTDGTFQGLYVTKDAGQNWTLAQLPNTPGNGSVKASIPTNTTTNTNSYDPTSSNFTRQGIYNLTLTVDPTNPNIVYIGGSQDFQGSGLIRVDLTNIYDAHNFTSFSNNRTDGGQINVTTAGAATQGGVVVTNPLPIASPALYVPNGAAAQSQILNLRYAPNNGTPGTSPFNINATLVTRNTTSFVNDGTGVNWSLFDEPLKANAGDVTGSTNLHQVISYIDPITGAVRMLFADDQGIFTALVNPDGTLNNGIGSDVAVNYSRNGNIQNAQFLDSAAQPSFVASQAASALFYASGQSTIAAQSDKNILTNGNLTWDNSAVLSPGQTSPRNTAANNSINSSDRSGVGIATDPTGATTSLYEFDVPILGGNLTDFFRVNQFGQTTGLVNNVNQEFPANGYRGDAHQGGVIVNPVVTGPLIDGQIPIGNFAVNPLNGNQILIGSAVGNLYETTNQGIQFLPIGNAASFGANAAIDGTGRVGHTTPLPIQLSAITFGAPDPNVTGGVGNLNNFIYAGTSGISYTPIGGGDPYTGADGLKFNDGHIYVTQAGGQGWTNISRGLDGSSVVGIYPSPDRGSHAAYAVTLTGVFYSPDTTGLAASGQVVWTNITNNLTSIQHNPFGNPALQESVLAGFSYVPPNLTINNVPNIAPPVPFSPIYTAQYGGFTGIVADYRYEIPAATNATQGTNIFFPVLYASGYGGVFRSIDNGATWTVFPNTALDAAPVDGGYLPSVDVTNLQLVLGNINPDTGHATQATGDPEILLASTYGRGDFAIRLAPVVLPTSVAFDANLPAPGGSDSGISNTDRITNVLTPYIDGISEVSNFGNTVTIKLYDQSPGAGFGHLLGTGTTDQLGRFSIQIVNDGTDPTFFQSSTAQDDKIVGIQATDSAGASGNLTLFKYTLDTILPATPGRPLLEPLYDTGRSSTDGLTDLSVPAQVGPGSPLTITAPVFDVSTPLPPTNPLSPVPIALTVELLRSTSPNGPFFLISSTSGGSTSPVTLVDNDVAALASAGPINQTFYYEAIQVDAAGNVSSPASSVLAVTVNTIAPAAPTGLTLDPSTNSGPATPPYTTNYTHPLFDVTGALAGDQLFLYRSIDGGAPILVGTAAVGATQVADTLGATMDGVYTYSVAQQDIYGNFSLLSPGVVVTINTQPAPAAPTLEAAYDTGRFNNDNKTNVAVPPPTPGSSPTFVSPVFDINASPPGANQPAVATLQLFRSASPNGPFVLVGTAPYVGNPVMVTDTTLASLLSAGPIAQVFYYKADQINTAGIESLISPALAVTVDNITPPTLPAPTLDPASNTGLVKSQLITNITKPAFNATNLLADEQLLLYRSTAGAAPILVGTAAVGATQVVDTVGAVPDGVYLYQVVQKDIFGNISNYSPAIAVTINTTTPKAPTISLLTSDDSGLPSHPNVTNVRTPHFVGQAQYNAGTNFPLDIINVATGQVVATTFPAANGTYLAQITTPLADGTYTLVARTTNLAGTFSFSPTLKITIKGIGPQVVPTLAILPADDTGIKGDGVTANHNPRFTGVTDPGVTVTLYAIINGVLSGPQATTTSSTINGSFTFKLPFNLTNGATFLVAQASDIANNKGMMSAPFGFRIVTTTGDYLGVGSAQLTTFDPLSETYFIRGVGAVKMDSTPGRDVPIQYDFNGDGITDVSAYRYNTAEYFGYVSNNTVLSQQFGPAGASLPVSGTFDGTGAFNYGSYQPSTGYWYITLPIPGGLAYKFGVPNVDIPTPAAFDGNYSTELAVFRGSTIFGGDADSFSVIGPKGFYEVSFTSPKVASLGFVYKAGDIPAPADYDGVGKDEFAVYRPSTGQFFILRTPDSYNPAGWTLRTVTLNLPGGPNAKDVPASEDYDGNGKADPTVYRPSNSTFYLIHSSTGIQENIQFGGPNQHIAAAGPLLYRLTALKGAFASNGGYPASPGGGIGSSGLGGNLHALSISSSGGSTVAQAAKAATVATSSPLATTIALATPIAVTTPAATSAPASAASKSSVTVGASTPKAFVPVVVASKAKAIVNDDHAKVVKEAKVTKHPVAATKSPAAPAKAQAVKASTTPAKSHVKAAALAISSLQHLVMARKGAQKS